MQISEKTMIPDILRFARRYPEAQDWAVHAAIFTADGTKDLRATFGLNDIADFGEGR